MTGSVSKRPLTPAEVAEAIGVQIEEVKHRSRQLLLAVSVANAAGFTAASAKVLDALGRTADTGAAVVALIFPSACLFLLGMFAAGLSAFADVVVARAVLQQLRLADHALSEGKNATQTVRRVGVVENMGYFALEAISGAVFLLGVCYPMVVLGHRYFRDGGFTW